MVGNLVCAVLEAHERMQSAPPSALRVESLADLLQKLIDTSQTETNTLRENLGADLIKSGLRIVPHDGAVLVVGIPGRGFGAVPRPLPIPLLEIINPARLVNVLSKDQPPEQLDALLQMHRAILQDVVRKDDLSEDQLTVISELRPLSQYLLRTGHEQWANFLSHVFHSSEAGVLTTFLRVAPYMEKVASESPPSEWVKLPDEEFFPNCLDAVNALIEALGTGNRALILPVRDSLLPLLQQVSAREQALEDEEPDAKGVASALRVALLAAQEVVG